MLTKSDILYIMRQLDKVDDLREVGVSKYTHLSQVELDYLAYEEAALKEEK